MATSFTRRPPDFVVIGAQRCGTTSLYSYLLEHPLIAGPRQKELHYFDLNYHRGTSWYLGHFPSSVSDLVSQARWGQRLSIGEATPYYLFHPSVPERLAALIPSALLIVILRDPVDRAFSHYHHEVRLGFETLRIEEALEREHDRLLGEEDRMLADPSYASLSHQHYSYVARGMYARQLERWWRHFPRERLFVLRSEDLFESPSDACRQVLSFLGLTPLPLHRFPPYNAGKYATPNALLRARLAELFTPHNERLEHLVGRTFGWTTA